MSVARRVKTAIDIVGAAILIGVLSPVLCVAALLIRLSSPGPVIHRRRVLGLNGVPFDAFKFRTMVVADSPVVTANDNAPWASDVPIKSPDDPRITPVGRWLRRRSIDELPQLFNVLRGEMSLVGPRIIAPAEAPMFGDGLVKRLSVKPGLTGLWQVYGRGDMDYGRRLALDLQYVDDWSLWLDVRILLRTIPAVLSMRGAY